jgi:general secretion pathway protein K
MRAGSQQSAVSSDLIRCGASIVISKQSTADCRLSTESGVILIALLWILTALSVIALSFSKESRVEVAAARNAQSLEDAYFVARGGIEETVYRMIQKRQIPAVKRAELSETPDPVDLGLVTGSLGGGDYQVDIQDESGKINVNSASVEQLSALAKAAGIPPEDADIIADSIYDWKDSDKLKHLNGAEDDYYQTLNPPYKAKNAALDTIEELLLVRGVTPNYFYGYPEKAADGSLNYKYGLSRYLTVYSNTMQINVNSAPLAVLLSIQGMPPQAAQMIYERRHVKPFKSILDVNQVVPMNLDTSVINMLAFNPTNTYTLTASAHSENSKAKRVIRTVIRLSQSERSPYQTLYWNENIPDYEGIKP